MLNQSPNGSDPASASAWDYFLSLMNYSNKTIFCQSPATSDTCPTGNMPSNCYFWKWCLASSWSVKCSFFLLCVPLTLMQHWVALQQHMLRLAISCLGSYLGSGPIISGVCPLQKVLFGFGASHSLVKWSRQFANEVVICCCLWSLVPSLWSLHGKIFCT